MPGNLLPGQCWDNTCREAAVASTPAHHSLNATALLVPSPSSLFITRPETGTKLSYCWTGREGQKMRESIAQVATGIWLGRSQQVNNGSFARLQLGLCYLHPRDPDICWCTHGQLCGHTGGGAALRREVDSQHHFLSHLSTSGEQAFSSGTCRRKAAWFRNLFVFAKSVIAKLVFSRSHRFPRKMISQFNQNSSKITTAWQRDRRKVEVEMSDEPRNEVCIFQY